MLKTDHKDRGFITGLAIVIIFYGVLHIFTRNGLLDDHIIFEKSKELSFVGFLQARYLTWSSRLLLEAVFIGISYLPFVVWQILDTAAFGVIYYGISKVLKLEGDSHIVAGMAIGSYVFLQMASAGWKITSISYIWTFATAGVCFLLLQRSLEGRKQGGGRAALYVLCMLFTCNYEIMAGVMLLIYVALLVWYRREKVPKGYLYVGIGLQLLSILFILTAPGNRVRTAMGENGDYMQLGLLGKLRIGMVSTFEHFVSIPNVLYGVLCLLVAMLVWKSRKKVLTRLTACLPLIIDVILTCYYLVKDILLGGKRNYVFDEPAMLPVSSGEWQRQGLLAVLFLVSAAALLYSLWQILGRQGFPLALLILAAGFASRMAMSFTPSVYESGTRTFVELYLSFVWVIAMLAGRLTVRTQKLVTCVCLAAGMTVNAVLTVIPYLQNYQ